jgi:hypothetical protein
VGYLGQALEIGNVAGRVGHDFGVDGLRVLLHCCGEIRRIIAVDERGLHTEAAQGDVELGDGPAVELGRGHNVVPGSSQRGEGDEFRGHAGRGSDGADAAFERGDPLLEGGHGGVANPRVDVAVLLQREEVGGVVGVLEDEGRGLVDRYGAGTVLGIGSSTRVQGTGAEAECAFSH